MIQYPDMSVSVTALNGFPLLTICGTIDAWHGETVENLIDGFHLDGTAALTMDLTRASFPDSRALPSLVRKLRAVCAEMRLALIADGTTAAELRQSDLEPVVVLCSSMDQAAESVRHEEYLTSRRLSRMADDQELPLAA